MHLDTPTLDEICIVNNHPLQKKVFLDPAQYKIVVSGRQFGKSTLLVEEALRMADERPNSISWLISPTREMGELAFWDKLQLRAKKLHWDVKTNQHSLSLYRYKNGSEIQIKSGEKPDRLRGATLDFAGIDEFREMKENIWYELIEPTLQVKEGRALFCSTPNGYDQVYRLYQLGQDTTQSLYKSWLFKSSDSPFMKEERINNNKKFFDLKTFRQEYEASFESAQGLVYHAFNRVNNVKPLQIDYSLPLRLSFDFNMNPMTTSICQIVEGNKEKNEQNKVLNVIATINTPNSNTLKQCKEIKRYLEAINYTGEIYIYGDPAGRARNTSSSNTDWEIIKQEFPEAYERVPKLHPAVSDRVNCMNVLFCNSAGEIGMYVNTENCQELIKDFEEVLYKDNNEINKTKNKNLTHNSDNVGYLVHKEFYIKAPSSLQIQFI